MPRTKEEKKEIVKKLEEKIKKQESMVFVNFKGLKMDDFIGLRDELKEGDAQMVVSKKSLLNLAFQKNGIEVDTTGLEGELAVIFGYEDVTFPAKTAYQVSRKNQNLNIIGGYLENQSRSREEMIQLAQIPSREELLAKLVGSIQAPVSGFVSVLNGNIRGLVQVLAQIKN